MPVIEIPTFVADFVTCFTQSVNLNMYMKKTQNELLVSNSLIAAEQQKLDKQRIECADLEAALHRNDAEAKEGTRQLGEIKMAIQNIYARCRVRGPLPENENLLLEAIQQRITDLQAIVTRDAPIVTQQMIQQLKQSQSSLQRFDDTTGTRSSAGKIVDGLASKRDTQNSSQHRSTESFGKQAAPETSSVSKSGSFAGASMASIDGGKSKTAPSFA